jgi:hypothetical protein
MIKIADNPLVRTQLTPAVARPAEVAVSRAQTIEFTRAPDGPGYRPAGRPPAMQRNNR